MRLFAFFFAGLLVLFGQTSPADAGVHTCLMATSRIEQREAIPRGLLYAIALTESGRWNKERGMVHAWPWTIRAKADAFVKDDARAAIDQVRSLKADGRRNIDVGCMQINLHYHPDAFTTLDEAFEPDANVAYAARFLKELRARHRSWGQAIQHYHSADPVRGRAYRKKVYAKWRDAQDAMRMASASIETGEPVATLEAKPARRDRPTAVRVFRPNTKSAASSIVQVAWGDREQTEASSQKRHRLPTDSTSARHALPTHREGIKRQAIHGVDIVRPSSSVASLFQTTR